VYSELKHEVFVDGEKTDLKAASYLYNGLTRHHVFGRGLNPGTQHTAYVIITDSAGHTVQSNTVSFDIKNIENYSYKDVLQESKNNSYDIYKNDIIDYLTALINDDFVSLSEKREFETRYQRYCFAYEGFRYVLDTCVKYINSQISTQQAEIAAIAAGLTSDGTSVATYSEDDYTNSNYQSITDMDYYQNECIRELTNRVLQLEALLQELMNNNN
jgi:hypothetical protein